MQSCVRLRSAGAGAAAASKPSLGAVKKRSPSSSSSSAPWRFLFAAAAAGGAAALYFKPDECAELYRKSPFYTVAQWISAQVGEIARPFTDPIREKLLQDWPVPGVPPGTPCPPTLVLDLEDTLVHMDWDRNNG